MNEIIEKIKKIDDTLANIILKNIKIDKILKEIEFTFLNNKTINENLKAEINKIVKDYAPKSFCNVLVTIIKMVVDNEILNNEIYAYIKNNFIAVSAFIKKEDIFILQNGENNFTYKLVLSENEYKYFNTNRVIEQIDAYLNDNFSENFSGEMEFKEKNLNLDLDALIEETEETAEITQQEKLRIYALERGEEIDGFKDETSALYMADCNYQSENITVCGEIVTITEKLTKTDKIYYIYEFSDRTFEDSNKNLKGMYFTKKKNLEKIKRLKVGDSIIASGKIEPFGNSLSFKIDRINYGKKNKDFIFEKRKSKDAPKNYKIVIPEPFEEFKQSNLFEQKIELPKCITENVFVVLDTETTGLNNNYLSGGQMDTLTEIGAVKIVNGIVTEKFSSLINPKCKISEEITKITGIDDSMVENAPILNDVIPDLFKFTRGAYIVGQNVDFDMKFIRYYSKEQGYVYDNKIYDTMLLSSELLHLSNNKLKTIAEYFGFEFNPHRAYDDAYVTAKIFIELIKIKKCLPNN